MTSSRLPLARTFPVRRVAALGEPARAWLVLILVWVFLEFGRPPNPLKLPLVISVTSILGWLVRRNKVWRPQSWGFLVFIGAMVISGLTAANAFSAFGTTRDMVIRLLLIGVPAMSLITSVDRIRSVVISILIAGLYVGGWAISHGGMGPSAASGGQDENYVAALMGMAIPFAYFSLFVEKKISVKVVLIGLLLIFAAAIALGRNPSRGGFVGLVAVTLYCLARSPKKVAGFTVVGIGAVVMSIVAGPKFWTEIGTTTDYQSGTADMRIEIWKMGLRMWQAHPAFGVGPGNFRWVIGDYQSAEQLEKFGRSLGGSIIAHSLPVELLAELGLAGALTLAWLIWRTWRDLGKVRNKALEVTRTSPEDLEMTRLRCYSDAMRGSMLAVLVNGLFLSLLHYSHIWFLIAVGSVFPIVLSTRLLNESPADPDCRVPVRASRSGLRTPIARPRVPRSPVAIPMEGSTGAILE